MKSSPVFRSMKKIGLWGRTVVRELLFLCYCAWLRIKYVVLYRKTVDNPVRPVWVPTQSITYSVTGRILSTATPFCVDRVVDGDWDRNMVETEGIAGDLSLLPNGLVNIENTDFSVAFTRHYEYGEPWQETEFYNRVKSQIERGKRKWGCSSVEELDRRFLSIDGVYRTIREKGYKTQLELGSHQKWDEIRIAVGRNGELFLLDGRHRLSIARLLRIDTIPVIVSVRHKRWNGDLSSVQRMYGQQNLPEC